MRTQRTASTLATDLADPHASPKASGNAGRSRTKSRFSGSTNAMLSQLRSIGGSRAATHRVGSAAVANRLPAPATVAAKEDPISDAVKWIGLQRQQVNAPPVGVTKLTREQTATMNRVVPGGQAPPAPPSDASGGAAKAQTGPTEHASTSPVIESDDELFELPLPAVGRPPHKTLLQLFDEERVFQHTPELPAGLQSRKIVATPAADDVLIEVDLPSGRVGADASTAGSSGPAAPALLKSTLRKPDTARRESKLHVSWHPDVRDTKFAPAQEKGGARHRTTDPELLDIQAKTRENEVLEEFGRLPVDEEGDEGNLVNQGVTGTPTPNRPTARREQSGKNAPSPSAGTAVATAAAPARNARRGGITGMLGRMIQLPAKLWR